MSFWYEPKVIVTSVLLLVIVRTVYKKTQITGRPPVVSYVVPWVGSAFDLGKNPDAFFRRAMYVEWLFICLYIGDKLSLFQHEIRRHLYGQGLRTEYYLCYFPTCEEHRKLS